MRIVEAVKNKIDELFKDNEVILFGSRARGDHNKDSDWDFLILLNKNEISRSEKEKIQELIYEIELQSGQVISSIIHTKEEWEKRSVTPIYQIIEEEGKRA